MDTRTPLKIHRLAIDCLPKRKLKYPNVLRTRYTKQICILKNKMFLEKIDWINRIKERKKERKYKCVRK